MSYAKVDYWRLVKGQMGERFGPPKKFFHVGVIQGGPWLNAYGRKVYRIWLVTAIPRGDGRKSYVLRDEEKKGTDANVSSIVGELIHPFSYGDRSFVYSFDWLNEDGIVQGNEVIPVPRKRAK